MDRLVTVELSQLAFEALAGDGRRDPREHVAARLANAVHRYLEAEQRDGPGWRYPVFLRRSDVDASVKVELSIDDGLWRSIENEAGRQRVSLRQMVEHAAFYLAAEVSVGRISWPISDGLEVGDSRGGKD